MNESEKNIIEYSYSNDTGDAQATVYQLFHGVEVAYTSVHMAQIVLSFTLFKQSKIKVSHMNGRICYFHTVK